MASAPEWLTLTGARLRNLRGFDLHLPLGRLIMVAGSSGAGKSTLFRDLLHPAVSHAIKTGAPKLAGPAFVKATGFADESLAEVEVTSPVGPDLASGRESQSRRDARSRPTGDRINRKCAGKAAPPARRGAKPPSPPPPFDLLLNGHVFRSVIEVDQSPIGKTPRSTPATYLGIFDQIRQFFASLPESKIRGYTASRYSFNTAGGRCEACSGAGRIKLEMAFMPDTYLPCDDCRGTRYAPELSDITWKGKNIGQVLQLTFDEASAFFDFHNHLSQTCRLMVDCGLGYLTLGQSSPTLSGGEAPQGLATVKERSRGEHPRNLYLLEEPTIGLHLSDCEKLIHVLHSLVDQGHTVVVIEHHLDLLAEADYIIELGPDGGPAGGELLYQGPLPGLLQVKNSPTAPYLRAKLGSIKQTEPCILNRRKPRAPRKP